jgi:hypothetical protein
MAQSSRYGYLETNGKAIALPILSRLVGEAEQTVLTLIEELKTANVFSTCVNNGAVYSRRMVRDYNKMDAGSKYGKKGGGNPALQPEHPPTPPKDEKKPDAIVQKPEAKGGIKDTYIGDFVAFWNEYPNRTGKKAAYKAWQNAKDKPPIEDILAAVRKQKASLNWTKDGGQFIPMPVTWLNQGRWDDQPTVNPVKSTWRPT